MKSAASLKAKAIAGNIRKIRGFRNYTQDYLAAKLGISQNAYSKLELGYSKLTLERLFNVSTILDVDVMQILNFQERDFVQSNSAEENDLQLSKAAN